MKYLPIILLVLLSACRPERSGGIEKITLYFHDGISRIVGHDEEYLRTYSDPIEINNDSILLVLENGLLGLEKQKSIGRIFSPPFAGDIIWGSGRKEILVANGFEINWDGRSYQVNLDWVDQIFTACGYEDRIGAW